MCSSDLHRHTPFAQGGLMEKEARQLPLLGGAYMCMMLLDIPLWELRSESAHRDFGTAELLLLHSRPEEVFQMGDGNFIRNAAPDFFRKNQSDIAAGSFFIGKRCICKLTG